MPHIGPDSASPYSVYYTDSRRHGAPGEPDYQTLVPLTYNTRNAAFASAFRLIEQKAVVWRILGPGKFLMNRDEIESTFVAISGKQPQY
jgi:hypothetical protein